MTGRQVTAASASPGAPQPNSPQPPGELAGTRLLAELRTEIARADSKAAVLVAALGLATGAFSGPLVNSSGGPHIRSGPGLALLLAGGGALILSLLALLLAVLPRYDRSSWTPGRPLAYFGDIHRAAELGSLANALAATEETQYEGIVIALTDTSAIVSRKHWWVRIGVLSFALGLLLLPTALLIG
ncbi:hypothetical protein P3T36_000479 [Kitasatospora sp. MAP12-15]|uniref:Pycsar system effector family protein n=1 Tax=unclassified Kitasatospora TaxID=2633591 RepID=UPI00247635A7|nr:Pycsar system effector family protein [Kitasatospora sp. MAP12-44]MDH6109708.1 hypothetical protein [Kitasatospora sp. MAP12-44]